MTGRLKHLASLGPLRARLAAQARKQAETEREQRADEARQQRAANEFTEAVKGVTPLARGGRAQHPRKPHPPHPVSRQRDDEEVLAASVSDHIDHEALLDTDESLSYSAPGIGPDVLRRLRRGEWSVQDEIDLHGHRVDEAREALVAFLRESIKRGSRCVRVVHGKGLGSGNRGPVLKNAINRWLRKWDCVLAFVSTPQVDGGTGAVYVLLQDA